MSNNYKSTMINKRVEYPDYLTRLSNKLMDSTFRKSFLDFDFVFQDLGRQMDSLLNRWDTYDTKPLVNHPVNIFKEGNTTTIEMALAGFAKDEIEVTDNNDGEVRTLTVSGNHITDTNTDEEGKSTKTYTAKQISARNFVKTFSLTNESTIDSVKYVDGILSIVISEPVPEPEQTETTSIKINID